LAKDFLNKLIILKPVYRAKEKMVSPVADTRAHSFAFIFKAKFG